MICRACEKNVPRNIVVASKSDTTKHVDNYGSLWEDKTCPTCSKRRAVLEKALRHAPLPPKKASPPKRSCRGCGCDLPVSHYFHCSYCLTIMSTFQDWNEVCGAVVKVNTEG